LHILTTPPDGRRALVIGLIVAALMLAAMAWCALRADAHDSWISRGGLKSPSGEGDCFVIPAIYVAARADGYRVIVTKSGRAPSPEGIDKRVSPFDPDLMSEIVPYAETQPSPDGAFWRCKRPDGSRRCFFAPNS
jgi:hypothetical protein